jgi:hypothetical protein
VDVPFVRNETKRRRLHHAAPDEMKIDGHDGRVTVNRSPGRGDTIVRFAAVEGLPRDGRAPRKTGKNVTSRKHVREMTPRPIVPILRVRGSPCLQNLYAPRAAPTPEKNRPTATNGAGPGIPKWASIARRRHVSGIITNELAPVAEPRERVPRYVPQDTPGSA